MGTPTEIGQKQPVAAEGCLAGVVPNWRKITAKTRDLTYPRWFYPIIKISFNETLSHIRYHIVTL